MEDVARLRLEILGDQAEQTVESLKSGLKDVNSELKLLEVNGQKGSEEWKELKRVQADIKDGLKELNQNIDLNNASWNDLNNVARRLKTELNGLTIGSEEWIDKLKQISEVDSKIEGTREEMKRLKNEGEEQTGFWTSFKANFTAAFAWDMIKEAGRAVLDFGISAVESFNDAAQSSAQLDASLKSTGYAAGLTREELDDLSASLAKKTRFDDDAIASSQSLLLTFTDIKKGVYEQAIPAILDMAEKMGGDSEESLKTTSIQVGKALNNPIEGMGALKRVGVTFTEDQVAVIKSLQETGDMAGAQTIILQELTKEFGGSAEAAAQAGTGGLTVLANRLGNVKESIGEVLVELIEKMQPAFEFVAGAIETGVTWLIKLVSGNQEVAESSAFLSSIIEGVKNVFGTLWDVLSNVWDVVMDVMGGFFKLLNSSTELYGGTNALTWAMDALRFALNLVGTILIGALTGVSALVDGFNILVNKGKEVANFFGADFKVDANATFDNLQKNAENNLAKIKNLWVSTANDGAAAQKKATDDTTKHHDTALKAQTSTDAKEKEKQKKAAEKLADDQLKANEASLKKQKELFIATIQDETQRKIASEKLKYASEKERIDKSKADEKNKAKELEALEKSHNVALEKINKDHMAKLKADDDKRAKEEEKARKDKAAAEKKERDAQLAGTKALFNAEFAAFTSQKNQEMALSRTTTQRKIQLITEESDWKKRKLQEDATAEKAKMATAISDETQRAAAYKAIDDKLASDLRASDAKLQADKTKALADANKARQDNTAQFFTALNGLAQGDFTAFMGFLDKKVKAEATANQQRLKDFSTKGQETLAVAAQVVQVMQTLNETFTAKKLAQIEKEKQAQIKSWEAQYKSGKISKEEYEGKISDINKDAAKKEHEAKVKAWKRDQTMQIAMAVINGAMAALKSLATMGFPLGLIGVAASAVMTGIQIGIIKGQKPPEAPSFKSGGYIRNAGVPQGPRHGSTYGESGIALWDRKTGQEVGEMEGGEPIMILSRNTYENNGDLIDKLHDSSLNRNGARIYANGGLINYLEPLKYGESYLFGSKKRKAARAAEAEEAANMVPDTEGMDSESAAAAGDSAAAIEASQKVQKEIADNTAATADALEVISKTLEDANGLLNEIKRKPTGISLHDLQSALASATAAGKKSNL